MYRTVCSTQLRNEDTCVHIFTYQLASSYASVSLSNYNTIQAPCRRVSHNPPT